MRVLLIAGGWSDEREVALSGARAIERSLVNLGHVPERLDPLTDFHRIARRAREADAAFLCLHGNPGEDGRIQALLDVVGLPYQGAGPAGSLAALHKAVAKQLFERHGLPTPAWAFLPADPGPGWKPTFGFPAFVKPESGGSSLDSSRVENREELRAALASIFAKHLDAMVEDMVVGPEVTCAVLGEEALPPILIRPKSGFFDYASKYEPDGAEELCPAPLPEPILAKVRERALIAHRLLGLRGVSRADFILDGDEPLILEVNTLPGMTGTSLLPRAAAAAGLSFEALIARLLELAMETAANPENAHDAP